MLIAAVRFFCQAVFCAVLLGVGFSFCAVAGADSRPSVDYWAVEDAAARARLPLYQVIPAARPDELTPANGFPRKKTFLTWERSHGDNGGMRYSALRQINRPNVTNLEVAWIYHSYDKGNALQCNPIIVRDKMFTPTPGDFVVAVNAATGAELWRFKPEDRPAFRGLIYWRGHGRAGERVMFCAGKYLYALDPETGQPISGFGDGGKVLLPGVADKGFRRGHSRARRFSRTSSSCPGSKRTSGDSTRQAGSGCWTFHTVPHPGEFGLRHMGQDGVLCGQCLGGHGFGRSARHRLSHHRFAQTELHRRRGTGATISLPTASSPWTRAPASDSGIFRKSGTISGTWTFPRRPTWPPSRATAEGGRGGGDDENRQHAVAGPRRRGKPIFPFRLRRAPTSDRAGRIDGALSAGPGIAGAIFQDGIHRGRPDRPHGGGDGIRRRTRFKSATTGFFLPCQPGPRRLCTWAWTAARNGPERAWIRRPGRLYVTANHVGWAHYGVS